MKTRIKFLKHGVMKFVGHLDILRYFQKALRRSGISVKFSEGFSPHMIMSFAEPLGVGIESDGEYFDLELDYEEDKVPSSEKLITALDSVMAEGMHVTDFREIDDNKKSKAMSMVAAAVYEIGAVDTTENEITFADYFGLTDNEMKSLLEKYLEQLEINEVQKSKKGERTVNIRPMIFEAEYKKGKIKLFCSAGSAANLRPSLFTESFFKFTTKQDEETTGKQLESASAAEKSSDANLNNDGSEMPKVSESGRVFDKFDFRITRKDIYAVAEDKNMRGALVGNGTVFAPLIEFGNRF